MTEDNEGKYGGHIGRKSLKRILQKASKEGVFATLVLEDGQTARGRVTRQGGSYFGKDGGWSYSVGSDGAVSYSCIEEVSYQDYQTLSDLTIKVDRARVA